MVAFGVALGLMNWSFYASLAHLPLGVAVTVEFLGPLVLTTVLSRRLLDYVAVARGRGRRAADLGGVDGAACPT